MHVISKRPFIKAAQKYPHDRLALMEMYRVLNGIEFRTPEELRAVFPSPDNFKYNHRWWVFDVGGNNLRMMAFMQTAHTYVNLKNEADYEAALIALEEILDAAEDAAKDPLNPLIEILSQAIETYEEQDQNSVAFLDEADVIPTDVALLRTLMRQHALTGSDFPEIGDKTMVSKVLNGKRILQRHAMELLGERFGIQVYVSVHDSGDRSLN